APSSASASAGEACTSSRACSEVRGGAPWICRASDKRCVPIATPECTPRYEPGDTTSDDTVWIGAMYPTTGKAFEAFGAMNIEGIDFARREIAGATRGLTAEGAPTRVRRIALVVCDDSSADVGARGAHHLVDDLGVPAVLGFGSGRRFVDLAGSLFI